MRIEWQPRCDGEWITAYARGPHGWRKAISAKVSNFDSIDHLRHLMIEVLDLSFSFGLVDIREAEPISQREDRRHV